MTVQKGQEWGRTVPTPIGLALVPDDAALADLVGGGDQRPVALTGGDLHRTVGGRTTSPDARGRATMRRVAVDLVRVRLDDRDATSVAHVVARSGGPIGWWHGRIVVICNAEHVAGRDVAPRAHPNDGLVDVVEVSSAMSLRQRLTAWRRTATGTHLPHPHLATSRIAAGSWRFEPPLDVWVDGRRHRRVRELRVTVEPDAFELHL